MNIPLKLWHILATKVLTVKVFDLFVQGAMLMVVFLEHNAFLLLRRDSSQNYIHMLTEDYVIMGLGGLQFLAASFVGWWGRRLRRLALAGWLAAAALTGLLVLALPFDKDSTRVVELCTEEPVSELSRYLRADAAGVMPALRTTVLVTTLALCSLAKVSVWAHGYTVLHDAQPHNAPHFYGILVSIQLSLGLSGKTMLEGSANDGDWWVPHLCISLLVLMFSLLFFVFPGSIEKKPDKSVDDGFLPSVKRVLSNKTVLLKIGAVGLMEGALFRFFQYDKEFVQARFFIDAYRTDLRSSRLVGTIFRPLTVVFFIMIFRVHWSGAGAALRARGLARAGAVLALAAAALFAAVAALGCDTGQLAEFQPSCSTNCTCDSLTYGFTPVCGLSSPLTYYSPCDAGCHTYINANGFMVFGECQCEELGATRGACSLGGCHTALAVYQVLAALVLAVAGSSLVAQGVGSSKAVSRADGSATFGTMRALAALTGQLLAHLLYYAVSYSTCARFDRGECQFHHPTIYLIAVISTVFIALGAVVSLLSSRVTEEPALLGHEDS